MYLYKFYCPNELLSMQIDFCFVIIVEPYRMEKDFNELEIQSQKRSEYEIHLSNLLCAHISNTSKYPVKT